MKKNIEYYRHFSGADQHPKFEMLRAKYGWSGDGKFWALNNRIALASNCILDLSKKRRHGNKFHAFFKLINTLATGIAVPGKPAVLTANYGF